MCDEIINAANILSTNVPRNVSSAVSTNVTSTASINFHNKKLRYKMDCYILHTILLVTILLFINAIISYHYTKHRSKQNRIGTPTKIEDKLHM